MPKPFILQQNEATSGTLAKQLELHQSTLSVMLSQMANAPQPLRTVGRTRIYDADSVKQFCNEVAAHGNLQKTANKLMCEQNLQRRLLQRAVRDSSLLLE